MIIYCNRRFPSTSRCSNTNTKQLSRRNKRWIGAGLILCLPIILLNSDCSLAPQTMPMDAHALGKYEPTEPDSFGTDAIGIEVLDNDMENYTTTDLLFSMKLGN